MDSKTLWDSVLVKIELEIPKATFTTWFKEVYILKIDNGVIYLAVPSTFVKDWFQKKYHKNILQNFRDLMDGVRMVEYVITSNNKKRADFNTEIPTQNKELPLNNLYIDPSDNLNPRYTFDTFIVGPFNELAYAASQAVIKKPVAYNPLYFYGNTGLGKTHLMQSIGNQIKQQNKEKRIHYVTSEKFTIDYVNSVQNNRVNHFKEKYRKYDVLIIDDIQFLSNKEKTQEEMFHLFNYMYDGNKQIIFSSDQHPNYLQNLEARLKSRFSAGMIVDISPLDTESKVAILKTKAAQNNFQLPDETAYYIASVVNGSIRELEGTLNSIICQTQLTGKELPLTEIKRLTKDSTKPQKSISVKDVVHAVASFYNIEEDSIYNKTRKQEVVKPRQLTMYILREDYNISFPSIGQKLGNRDHTTVMHSCEKIKNELKSNSELIGELNQIRGLL